MKNVLRFTLAAFVLAGMVTTAYAQNQTGRGWRSEDVRFRTNAAANPAPGSVDSLQLSVVSGGTTAASLDTTVAISTAGWDLPDNPKVVGDSITYAKLIIYDDPVGDSQSGADSLGIAVQVSADGATWACLGAVPGQEAGTAAIASRNDQTIANGVFMTRLSANGASLANGPPYFQWNFKKRANTTAVNDVDQMYMAPFVRFIVLGSSAVGYKLRAKIVYYSNQPN